VNKHRKASTSDIDLNNNLLNLHKPNKSNAQQQQQSNKSTSKFNKFQNKSVGQQQQQQQQSASNPSLQNFWKKSANLSAQAAAASYMQSVRESRSPSPNSYASLNS
jgi:hypothetical protein